MKPSNLIFLPSLGMILTGVFSILWVLSYGSELSPILLGFLVWIVSVGLKYAWSAKNNKKVKNFLQKNLPSEFSEPVLWGYIGLLTGIFEVGISLLFVLLLRPLSEASWQNAMGFGIGLGGFEAIFLGLFSFLATLHLVTKRSSNDVKNYWKNLKKYPLTSAFVPIVERAVTIPIHVFTSVLIILSVQQSNHSLFWASFVFKSFVDAIAGWSHLKLDISNWKKPQQIWLIELLFTILGLISVAGLFWLFNLT